MKLRGFLSALFLLLLSAAAAAATPLPRQAGHRQSRSSQVIRVGGKVQVTRLVHRVIPKYPAKAKKKRIQGTVVFQALIGQNGHIEKLRTLSGEPILVKAARAAVRQWVYKPTSLNGRPVKVETEITVIFSLAPRPKPKPKSAK